MTAKTVGATAENQPRRGLALRRVFMIVGPILVIALFWFAGFMLKAMQPDPVREVRERAMTQVEAEPATRDDVTLGIIAQGETAPQTEITLVPQASGKITFVSSSFNDGGAFTKGDVMLRIDPSDYQVAVSRAEADVAQAEQTLVQEQAEAELAKRDWEDLGDGPASALTLREPQLRRAQASLDSAQAGLDNARLQYSRTIIRAPFTGRVRTKLADIGQFVSPGTPLAQIFSSEIMEVRLPLSDQDLQHLNLPIAYVETNPEESLNAELRAVIAGQMRVWNGRVVRTDSAYDPQTRAISAIVEVSDPYADGASEDGMPLPPGLFVTAEIEGRSYENVFVIPRSGLRANDEVFTIADNNDLVVKTVNVIDTSPERAVIASGLNVGDLVITSGIQRVTPGMKVRQIGGPEPVRERPDTEDTNDDADSASEAGGEN